MTNLVTPPSCTSADHSPVQRQGRGLRGVPRSKGHLQPAPHPSALQDRDRPGGPPANPAVLQGRCEEGLQLGPVPCNPAGAETGTGVSSWSLTLQPYQADRPEAPPALCPLQPCKAGTGVPSWTLHALALQGIDGHEGPQLSHASRPAAEPSAQAAESHRKAQVLSRRGLGREGGGESTTTKG